METRLTSPLAWLCVVCLPLGLGCQSDGEPIAQPGPGVGTSMPTTAPPAQPAAPAPSGSAGAPATDPGNVAGAASTPTTPDPMAQPTTPDPMVLDPTMPDPMMPAPQGPLTPFGTGPDALTWRTDAFMLEAGQEQYLCFASTLDEDLVINAYSNEGGKFIHHIIFSRATAPEPEGFAECDVAFRNSWETLFISGAGNTTLEFPADAGHVLAKGTQVVVQMHLLNQEEVPVSGALTIHMRRSSVANPRPVNSYIFGTAAVELPAGQTTEVVGTCGPFQNVQLIAGFPHMHLLGRSMTFEVAMPDGTMQEAFKRDPFDFDDQHIDPVDLTISAGQTTRVRCTFDNPGTETVGYGESTHNEMCYFVGFAVDLPSMSACLEVLPPFIFGG